MTNELKITPPPWIAYKATVNWHVKNEQGHYIMEGGLRGLARQEADAHLIAASPRLYKNGDILFRLALQSDRYANDPEFRDAVDDMGEALKQARGETGDV